MITAIQARNAKPREKAYKLNDGKGLFLHIATSGKKTWRYRYELPPGTESTFVIGEYPVMSLEEARVERAALREMVKAGIRPADVRRQEKRTAIAEKEAEMLMAENSFEAIALEWLTLKESGWRASHTRGTRRSLQNHVFPCLGPTPVDKITPPMVLEVVRAVEAKGALEMASKTLQRIGAVFRFAIQTGRATYNPAADMRGVLKAKKPKHHPFLKKDELPAFFQAMEKGNIHPTTKKAILFTILTAARSGETRLATWGEIDWEQHLWLIPAGRMKMGSVHKVPLSRQTMAILAAMRPYATGKGGYIFPGIHRGEKPLSANTMLYGLYDLGYKGKTTMHGFRATFSTILNEDTTFDKDAIERALDHRERNRVRAAYHHSEYLPERTEMMQWWADYLDLLREG